MVVIRNQDVWTLLPLSLLSVVYWIRDRYMFNRSPERLWSATLVQRYTLSVLYPIWIFLAWVQGIQTRQNLTYALITTTGCQTIRHLSSTSILNDSFLQTRQQIVSSMYGLFISYVWCVYNHIAYASNSQSEVDNIESHNNRCYCNASS